MVTNKLDNRNLASYYNSQRDSVLELLSVSFETGNIKKIMYRKYAAKHKM